MDTAAVTSERSSTLKQAAFTPHRLQYWDPAAPSIWMVLPPIRNYNRRRVSQIYSFLIPPGMRVLEVGCGQGDLLASVGPSYGVLIDLSPLTIERAQRRHPEVRYLQADGHSFDLKETIRFCDLFRSI
jgi:SAM-dependent methyltransferase